MSDSTVPDLPDVGDVKKRQYIIIALLLLLVCVVFGYLYFTGYANRFPQSSVDSPGKIELTTPGATKNVIKDWSLKFEQEMEAIKKDQAQESAANAERQKALMAEIQKLQGALDQERKESQRLAQQATQPSGLADVTNNGDELLKLPLPTPGHDRPINQPTSIGQPSADGSTPNTVLTGPNIADIAEPAGIVKVTFQQAEEKKRAHIRDTVPAGSFGKAVLLSGLDAPTGGKAERNPIPVLLELLDNGNLPNRYRHRVQQCRIVGSGRGNISDERAYIRLERLTCVLKNGDIVSEVATGSVIGEDGSNGLRGILREKQGQLLANAFLAGSLGGIGEAFSQSYSTVSTTPQGSISTLDPDRTLEAGFGKGLGNSLEKIADFYIERANDIFPVIEVKAGRIVEVLLTEDLALNANLLDNHTPVISND